MKKMVSIILIVACMITFSACTSAFGNGSSAAFSDVPKGAWYEAAVTYSLSHGILSGTSDTTFSPDEPMTRAMLAVVLYRMADRPAVSTDPLFSDVAPGSWYADAAAWAYEEGVISGYGSGLFGSDDAVTREQLASILWRYAGSPAGGAAADFADASAISEWAVPAVRWARSAGVVSGREDHRFAPKDNVTRAEAAVMLYRWADGSEGGSNLPETATSAALVRSFDFEARSVTLNSGYQMPIYGLGTYSLHGDECVNSVTAALRSGVRLIDTAHAYGNEEEIGRAIRSSGVPREEIFVITKLYPDQFSNPQAAIDEALNKLDLGYIDMMLLHHPGAGDVEAYRAMERAAADGKIRSLGLSKMEYGFNCVSCI